MLQVWLHMFFIYFLYKFSFFSKKLFQQQKNLKSIWIFFLLLKQIFCNKNMCSKRKIPGDTQNVFMKLKQSVAISRKSHLCPQSFSIWYQNEMILKKLWNLKHLLSRLLVNTVTFDPPILALLLLPYLFKSTFYWSL